MQELEGEYLEKRRVGIQEFLFVDDLFLVIDYTGELKKSDSGLYLGKRLFKDRRNPYACKITLFGFGVTLNRTP